jgi:hypothetical protein
MRYGAHRGLSGKTKMEPTRDTATGTAVTKVRVRQPSEESRAQAQPATNMEPIVLRIALTRNKSRE